MKLLILLAGIALAPLVPDSCKHHGATASRLPGCYRARLEVKGGCMNYTISVLDKNVDTSLVVRSWTDETTGKTYHNVFGLRSRCNFPDSIRQGDEFYFVPDSTNVQNCVVCLMYYPVPAKKMSIKVLPAPCSR